MTRPATIRAIATKDSISNLFAIAEANGTAQVRVMGSSAFYRLRNACYAHRTSLRRSALALQGIEASHLDAFKFDYRLEEDGYYYFTISYDVIVEFEFIVPESWEGDLPHFDTGFDAFVEQPPPPDYDHDYRRLDTDHDL